MEIAVLALGCFWGPEIKFSKINGVIKTEVGYCGGNSPTTTYKEVCTGDTNHAEVVKLDFDEKIISFKEKEGIKQLTNSAQFSYNKLKSLICFSVIFLISDLL